MKIQEKVDETMKMISKTTDDIQSLQLMDFGAIEDVLKLRVEDFDEEDSEILNMNGYNDNEDEKETLLNLNFKINEILDDMDDKTTSLLICLKYNCLCLLRFVSSYELDIPTSTLDAGIELIFNTSLTSNSSENESLEIKQLKRDIYSCIIDICIIKNYLNSEIEKMILEKMTPDELSINLCFLTSLNLKSYDLSVLRKLELNESLVKVIKMFKGKMKSPIKRRIISDLRDNYLSFSSNNQFNNRINNDGVESNISERRLAYSIYSMINETEQNDLLESEYDNSIEYIGFITSLIKSSKSASLAFEKLEPFFDKLELALENFLSYSKINIKTIKPNDKKIIYTILQSIIKLIKYKKTFFYKYLNLFQDSIEFPLPAEIKGPIYTILTEYLMQDDILIRKNINCKFEIEEEIKNNKLKASSSLNSIVFDDNENFKLLRPVIKFINIFEFRIECEKGLLKSGKSLGSPYILDTNEEFNVYKMLAFKSEDPTTICECLNGDNVSIKQISLNSFHLRNACIKNDVRRNLNAREIPSLVGRLLHYQLKKKKVVNDTTIINLIISKYNSYFFDWVRLFEDFTFYLNKDLLDRISDLPEKGLSWILDSYNREMGDFVIINCNLFNSIILKNKKYQLTLLKIYSKILEDNFGRISIVVHNNSNKGLKDSIKKNTAIETFYVYDDENLVNVEFFEIFSHQLIYEKFYKSKKSTELEKFILKKLYPNSKGFMNYIKSKIVCGLPYKNEIIYFLQNLMDVDDLMAWIKIVKGDDFGYVPKNESIYSNFKISNTEFFMRNFKSSPELERFMLLFSLSPSSTNNDSSNKVIKKSDNINTTGKKTTIFNNFDTKVTEKVIDEDIKCSNSIYGLSIQTIIKDEVLLNINNPNEFYLEMCILQLFNCSDLDNIIQILEKNLLIKRNLFSKLLSRLSLYNLIKGGKYFSKKLLDISDKRTQARLLFMAFSNNICDRDTISQYVSQIDINGNSEFSSLLGGDILRTQFK